jgi:ribosomal protein S18 acetylase RimI-like enzyme
VSKYEKSIQFDGYRPGSLAGIVKLHAIYYSENWGFGKAFEVKVASELEEFLNRMDPEKDFILVAYIDEQVIGSIVIDSDKDADDIAHLRWFIVAKNGAGRGLGKHLLSEALSYCEARNLRRVWLTTFAGLDAARALYERHGFVLKSESEADQWGGNVREQLFEKTFHSAE